MKTEYNPYKEFKDAHVAGKIIQWCNEGYWIDLNIKGVNVDDILFIHPAKDYRVKPLSKDDND